MKKLIALTVLAAIAVASPAQAQLFKSGNSGLLGLGNNLLGIQTGHISVLNGGILNGSNVLSGIGLGAGANASNSSANTTGSGHLVVPHNAGTVVPGNNNALGNDWSTNAYSNSFNSFRRW